MYKMMLGLAALTLASPAAAATLEIKNLGVGNAGVAKVDTSAGADLEASMSFDAVVTAGSNLGMGKSPYEILGTGNFETLEFFVVSDPTNLNFPIFADLTIAGGTNRLSFLWGTPDLAPFTGAGRVTNGIELFFDGVSLGTLDLADMAPAYDFSSEEPVLTQLVSDVLFDQVRFSTDRNAFELSNLSTQAVPIPAGFVLMAGGLGLIGLKRRKAS
ncbi:MAG: hypothetical protein AAF830_13240 [Pseudomonadota bacterium]